MSLTISLRIPDGIVLAADSLATQTSLIQVMTQYQTKCPNCQAELPVQDLKLPPLPITSSTRSFAQKITSLKTKDGRYSLGIATFGMGLITGRTIYNHLRMLNQAEQFSGLEDAAEKIADYFHHQLAQQFPDLSSVPENSYPLGFQIVGYQESQAHTFLIHIGRDKKIELKDKIGCTYGGQGFLIQKMWEIHRSNPQLRIIHDSLSLQDAVDLAAYYINSTASFLRFASIIPNVGGDVDIAFVTQYSGFKWIKCKELTKILERDKEQNGEQLQTGRPA